MKSKHRDEYKSKEAKHNGSLEKNKYFYRRSTSKYNK